MCVEVSVFKNTRFCFAAALCELCAQVTDCRACFKAARHQVLRQVVETVDRGVVQSKRAVTDSVGNGVKFALYLCEVAYENVVLRCALTSAESIIAITPTEDEKNDNPNMLP